MKIWGDGSTYDKHLQIFIDNMTAQLEIEIRQLKPNNLVSLGPPLHQMIPSQKMKKFI